MEVHDNVNAFRRLMVANVLINISFKILFITQIFKRFPILK